MNLERAKKVIHAAEKKAAEIGQPMNIAVVDEAFVRNELFRPFRSTKSAGYGIGAYQTRELIRMAGGELEVVSRPSAGTTMRIALPLAESGATAMPSAAA